MNDEEEQMEGLQEFVDALSNLFNENGVESVLMAFNRKGVNSQLLIGDKWWQDGAIKQLFERRKMEDVSSMAPVYLPVKEYQK